MPVFVAADEAFVVAALRAGLVPPEVASAPVRSAKIPEGLALEPSVPVSAAQRQRLIDAGFGTRRSELPGATTRASWAEVVAARSGAEPEPPLPHVLLVCPREHCLRLVSELLRLGCDDQHLCFFVDEDGVERAACRAVAPPYYVVLDALERGGAVEAYLPASGRAGAWVAAGYEHPLVADLQAPPGQLVLVRPEAAWRRIPDGPWRSIARHLDIEVPPATALQPIDAPERYTVTLQLVRSSSTPTPSLWVLRGHAVEAVDRLVRSLPAAALEGLAFAALQQGETKVVVIRARRLGRTAPPALELPDAEPYAALPLLDRIHVPPHTTIAPPLRIERLVAALAPDPDRLVWLVRLADGSPAPFRVETAPELAFEPLSEWVEHVAAEHAEPLQRWMAQAVFEFEPFTADEDARLDPGSRPRAERSRRREREVDTDAEATPVEVSAASPEPSRGASPIELRIRELEPSRRAQELARIEGAILDHDGAADDPALTEQWATLAAGYEDRGSQAGLSWTHALWETPPGELWSARAAAWCESEARLGGDEAFALVDDPTVDRVRAVASRVIAGAVEDPTVAGWLRVHDSRLATRAYWLLWDRLAAATSDTLARVRATDEVLGRLRGGLSSRDVPAFVRADSAEGERGGSSVTGRLGDELRRTQQTYEKTRRKRSAVEASAAPGLTDGYAQLVFAWGYARLGLDEDARQALARADALHGEAGIDPGDPAHAFLRAAYRERVQQALDGLALETPMSAERLAELEALTPDPGRDAPARGDKLQRYKVDRLRQHSLILDWSPNLDAIADFTANRQRNGLDIGDAQPATIAATVDALLACSDEEASQALPRAVALGRVLPSFLAVPRLEPLLAATSRLGVDAQVAHLEGVTLIAGRCEHWATVAVACRRFETLLTEDRLGDRNAPALALARLSGTLRRAGQTPKALEVLAARYDALPGNDADRVAARLQLATAMAILGHADRLDEATAAGLEILGGTAITPGARLALTRQLMLALGRASPERAVAGVRALLKRLRDVTDSFNTNSHFCLSVLAFVESLVLGLARPDVLGSERARRFVEDDEHRIRQRLFAAPGGQ